MASRGYGEIASEHFVGFLSELSRGTWATFPVNETPPSLASGGGPVLVVFKTALTREINRVVAAQGAANDVETAGPAWSKAERRFVVAVELLTLDDDPEIARAAERVQTVLCEGGSRAMTLRSLDEKVAFGRNQLAVAATPATAALVERLGLGDKLDDIRERTDDLADAIRCTGGSAERRPRSKRITRATATCAAVFNWVHEGLARMAETTHDPSEREALHVLIAPFEDLLARRTAEAPAEETDANEEASEPKPLAPTG